VEKAEALERLAARIGDRRLVWFGDVGQDARGLLELPQFSHCYCGHSPPESDRLEVFSLEALTGRRPADGAMPPLTGPLADRLMAWLKSAIGEPCLIMTRTPLQVMPVIQAMSRNVQYLGITYKAYTAFSDKRAMEAGLARQPGVNVMPWQEVPNGEARQPTLLQMLREGPIVLRGSEQIGGTGHEVIRDEARLATSKLARADEPTSVCPLFEGFFTVGVGACVFADGGITVHTACVVMNGDPAYGPFDLGWGGNDYGVASKLSPEALERVEAATRSVGAWLHGQGYVGIFGYQGLVNEDEIYYVEISARFGGKSRLSVEIDDVLGCPNVLLDHVMACLGMESYETRPLAELAGVQPSFSHVVCRNWTGGSVQLIRGGLSLPEGFTADLLPAQETLIERSAVMCVVRSTDSTLTPQGKLTEAAAGAVRSARSCFEPA
jgi:hypothetical protein